VRPHTRVGEGRGGVAHAYEYEKVWHGLALLQIRVRVQACSGSGSDVLGEGKTPVSGVQRSLLHLTLSCRRGIGRHWACVRWTLCDPLGVRWALCGDFLLEG
jgi:hypothetical protein